MPMSYFGMHLTTCLLHLAVKKQPECQCCCCNAAFIFLVAFTASHFFLLVQRVKSRELDSNLWHHKYTVCSSPCWASRMPEAGVLFPWQHCGEVEEGRETESVPTGSTSQTTLTCYDWLGPRMEDNLTYTGSDLLQLKWMVQFKYTLWWHAMF